MSSWRQQALIEAPIEEVWRLIGDPARYPEWAGYVIEVTGLPAVEPDATFRQVTKTFAGNTESDFKIEEVEELREIKLRCTESGLFSRWVVTEAQENTFLDAEIGIDPTGFGSRVVDATIGKRWYRRLLDESVDGLKQALAAQPRGR